MSIEQNYKFGVTLSESVIENFVRCPLAENHQDFTSGLQENIIISEAMHERGEVSIEHL